MIEKTMILSMKHERWERQETGVAGQSGAGQK